MSPFTWNRLTILHPIKGRKHQFGLIGHAI